MVSAACRPSKDVTKSNLPLTQKRKLVPYYGVHRDKESLVEEMETLISAFQDQKFHFAAHKSHHHAVHMLNRRLEEHISYLETSGLEARRSGTLTMLKSRSKGYKARFGDLQVTVAANVGELKTLSADYQVSRTREATLERDEFALECRRLQKCVRTLRSLYKKVLLENKISVFSREHIPVLETKHHQLEASVTEKRKSVDGLEKELSKWNAKSSAADRARESDDKRFKRLQSDNKSLMEVLLTEKLSRQKDTIRLNELKYQVRLVERASSSSLPAYHN